MKYYQQNFLKIFYRIFIIYFTHAVSNEMVQMGSESAVREKDNTQSLPLSTSQSML